jgi:hypothetical protein
VRFTRSPPSVKPSLIAPGKRTALRGAPSRSALDERHPSDTRIGPYQTDTAILALGTPKVKVTQARSNCSERAIPRQSSPLIMAILMVWPRVLYQEPASALCVSTDDILNPYALCAF